MNFDTAYLTLQNLVCRKAVFRPYSYHSVSTEVNVVRNAVNHCLPCDSSSTFERLLTEDQIVVRSAKWWNGWSTVCLLDFCIQDIKCLIFPCGSVNILCKARQMDGEINVKFLDITMNALEIRTHDYSHSAQLNLNNNGDDMGEFSTKWGQRPTAKSAQHGTVLGKTLVLVVH